MLATCLQPFYTWVFEGRKGRLYLSYGAVHCIGKEIQAKGF
jgi:hypothetical protein